MNNESHTTGYDYRERTDREGHISVGFTNGTVSPEILAASRLKPTQELGATAVAGSIETHIEDTAA